MIRDRTWWYRENLRGIVLYSFFFLSAFCLHVNQRLVNMYKKEKNFEAKMRQRGLTNMQTKE